jgi:hypothetical protein
LGNFGSLLQGYGQFQAPTGQAALTQDPGYQFRLQQGVNALQNSAAAKGTLLSGSTAAGINAFGQDYASNEYQNVYNRSLQNYLANRDTYQTNQQNQFNRLAALMGVGQNATTDLGRFGQNYAGQYANTLMGATGAQNDALMQGANARAAGTLGGAGSWLNMFNGLGSLGTLYGSSYNPFARSSPAFPGMSPGQISGAYGGPTSVPTIPSPYDPGLITQ